MPRQKTETARERGHRIKTLRDEQSLSQADLGLAVGAGNGDPKNAERSVQQWENEGVRPHGKTLTQIARVLKTSTRYIVDGVDEPDPTTEREIVERLQFLEAESDDRRADARLRGGFGDVAALINGLREDVNALQGVVEALGLQLGELRRELGARPEPGSAAQPKRTRRAKGTPRAGA